MSWEVANPFIKADGSVVMSPAEWPEQSAYLKEILAEDLYGRMPSAPGNVQAEKGFTKELWDGTAVFEVYDLSFGPENKVHEDVAVIRACGGDGAAKPVPIVLCGGYVDEAIAKYAVSQGFCIATPLVDDAAPDEADYQKGTLYQAYPDAGFKVIAMWGWLMSRVIDWLETVDFVDHSHVVAAGHSRFGKAALACAVYDERVSVCAAGGSGCGGIGSLRVAGGRFGEGKGDVETLGGMITGMFPHWFVDTLVPYGAKEASRHNRENELRFDADFIGAAIAPRPLILVEGLDDTWANPYGTLASWSAAAEVYHFLGADEKCAIHEREGGHALNLEDWTTFLDFCKVQLSGAKPTVTWHTRTDADPAIARSWSAENRTGEEVKKQDGDEKPANTWSFTPESIAAMKARFNTHWAFAEAGLETGIDKFMKTIIAKAEAAMAAGVNKHE